jgi:hypothetical protein
MEEGLGFVVFASCFFVFAAFFFRFPNVSL